MEKEPEKIEFKLEGKESDSIEEEEPHTPFFRRSSREIRQPERYSPPNFHSHFAMSIIDDDPRNVKEFFHLEYSDLWKKNMVEEMDALEKSEDWNLVQLPSGREVVGRKWVFKNKLSAKGKAEKYKTCLVEKGYSQVEGIDFGEIFFPVAKLTSIRFLLSIVVVFLS